MKRNGFKVNSGPWVLVRPKNHSNGVSLALALASGGRGAQGRSVVRSQKLEMSSSTSPATRMMEIEAKAE